MQTKKEKKLISVSLFGAFAASLCCITPLFALVAGLGGFASTFSWLDPVRPHLIIFSVFILGFVWYQKLKPKKEIDCECEGENKSSFLQSKLLLGLITIFAIIMMAFPYYSNQFFNNDKIENEAIKQSNLQSLEFEIVGMTCEGCETFVEQRVSLLNGIDSVKSNFKNGSTIVVFDSTKTNSKKIIKTINETSYKANL